MTSTQTAFVNYYEVLEIDRKASDDDIRSAVRDQRRKWRSRQNAPDPQRRAEAESRMRQIDEAEKTLTDSAKRKAHDAEIDVAPPPSRGEAGPAASADEWLVRAVAFLKQSNPRSANYAAREACHAAPENAVAWYVRARSSALLGQFHDAEFEYGESLRLDSTNIGTHIDFAQLRQRMGNWRGAFSVLQDAWKLDPDNPEVHLAMAECYVGAGKPDQALPLVEPLAAENPANESLQAFLASVLYEMATDKLTQPDPDKYVFTSAEQVDYAIHHLDRALSLKFSDEQLRNELRRWRKLATEAGTKTYVHTTNLGPWAVAFVVGALLIFAYGLGILVLAGLGYWYYTRHWLFKWQVLLKACQQAGVSKWGIGPH